jgi:hypothetical protein
MPKALVFMAVTQIAPGTIGHGVWLIEDHVPRSGYPGRPAILGCAALIFAKVQPPPKPQISLQFLRANQRTETSCAQERRCWKPLPRRAGKMTSTKARPG